MDELVRKSPLLQEVVNQIRVRHYSRRTEDTYLHWVKRYIYFHNKRHPKDMSEREVAQFLTHLAVHGNVAASTQNIALNALVFMYRNVLDKPLKQIDGIVRAKKPQRLPVVLTQREVSKILSNLNGQYWLIACLQYGSGLRLIESVRLRVLDLDYDRRAIYVRNGKGGKDRIVTLADEIVTPLKRHLEVVRTLHERDIADGFGAVYLPHALAKKYPNAEREWKWQYLFPAKHRSIDPRAGIERRHHVDESCVRKAVTGAVLFRHPPINSFEDGACTELFNGCNEPSDFVFAVPDMNPATTQNSQAMAVIMPHISAKFLLRYSIFPMEHTGSTHLAQPTIF